jgi:hypothetical protein
MLQIRETLDDRSLVQRFLLVGSRLPLRSSIDCDPARNQQQALLTDGEYEPIKNKEHYVSVLREPLAFATGKLSKLWSVTHPNPSPIAQNATSLQLPYYLIG